ncbi:MAG: WD40 repeat domain-containing protein [Marinobacter sp.]|nr:WD40 repeat domain-containing protein [Marinobacter sp.]
MIVVVALLAGCGDRPSAQWRVTERGGVFTGQFDSAGSWLTTGAVLQGGGLWRVEDQRFMAALNHQSEQTSVIVAAAFSPDGRHLLTAEPESLVWWDAQSGRGLAHWRLSGGVQSLALSGGAQWALIGMRNADMVLLDVRAGQVQSRIRHGSSVSAVAISRDGRWGYTGSDDGVVSGWDLQNGVQRFSRRYAGAITVLALSPDEKLLLVGAAHHSGEILTAEDGGVIKPVGRPRATLSTARFSSDSRRLLLGHPSGEVGEWHVHERAPPQRWQVAPDRFWQAQGRAIVAVAYGQDNGRVMALTGDGGVMVWARN